MRCGREPGGDRADELGVCVATTKSKFNGVNRGQNGGRYCWAVAGTLCKGKVQGMFADKLADCLICPFFQNVQDDESNAFIFSDLDLEHI